MKRISASLIAKTAVTATVLLSTSLPYVHAAQTEKSHHHTAKEHTHTVKPQLPVNIGVTLPGSAEQIAPIMAEDTHSTQINDTSQESDNQYTSDQQTNSEQSVTDPEALTNQQTNNKQTVTDPESLTDQQSYNQQTVTDAEASTSQETNNQHAQTVNTSTTETVAQVKPTYVSLENSSLELSHLPDAGEHKSNYLPILAALILLAGAAIMLFTRKRPQK